MRLFHASALQFCQASAVACRSMQSCQDAELLYRSRLPHLALKQDWLQLLKAFFLDLRAKQGAVEGNCVTLRQLESLIRLCEARARMDLRELVTLVSTPCSASFLAVWFSGR